MLTEQRTQPSGLMYGSYPAVVIDTVHPKGLYMVKVRLLSLWDEVTDPDLPWATFLLPIGAKPNGGHAIPVEVGDNVWIDFPINGDTRYPRITGSIYYAPDYQSHLPNELFGTGYAQKRLDSQPPAQPFSIKDDLYSRFGLIEQKSQEGNWCICHKGSGSAIEITAAGELVLHCQANSFRSSKGDTEEVVAGALTINVQGPVNIITESDYAVKAQGNINFTAGGSFNVTASSANFDLG